MKTKEILENEIANINAILKRLEEKKFDVLNEADKRNLNRECEEAKSKLEIAERELENIK